MAYMTSLRRDLVFLILQFLDEEKFRDTAHKLEQESGFFFNMSYLEDEVQKGNWDEVETYLSRFTKVDDNSYSMKIFFEIRKQKYFEALDKHDRAKAVDILIKDLKVFAAFNAGIFRELTQLLPLENFRENEQLSRYGDTKSARLVMLGELKKLIQANPLFRDKLQFPSLMNSRLRTLINHSLNWQHHKCQNPRPNPEIKTLFVDHTCVQTSGAGAPSPANNPLLGSFPTAGAFPPGFQGPFQAAVPAVCSSLTWMSNTPPVAHPAVPGRAAIGLGAPPIPATSQHPNAPPTNSSLDFPVADSDHASKRMKPMRISNEANLPVNMPPVTFPSHSHLPASNAPDDLPKNVARSLIQGSSPMSMDFHPIQQTLLLVGTNVGEIALWEVGSRERLILRNFEVWGPHVCSTYLQAALFKEPRISVNRIIWSPDGTLFGVAYSMHIVQIYSYYGGGDLRQHLEMDAHNGGVNDLSFSQLKQLCVITCGDDKTIKVWDATTGAKKYTFEGHEAPVYSICSHYKENIQFIFSTALDGKIKAWLYDNMGSRVNYDAPGQWCTTMAYSADGTRLFSCGTSKDGESFLVEWNASVGVVERTYQGFGKHSLGVVQFDTTKSRYLAAGDEFCIKFWDMDNTQILAMVDAEGCLPATPRIRFNKDGTLLAASARDNTIKILANSDGFRMLRTFENLPFEASRTSELLAKPMISCITSATVGASAASMRRTDIAASALAISEMIRDARSSGDVKPKIAEDNNDKSKTWKLTEINEPSHCRSLRLPENLNLRGTKISRLIYTNSGRAILALASNATHLLWKWHNNDINFTGKATASVPPQLWQPTNATMMINDIADINQDEAVPCFALSNNDSYVMSASGGRISLFNMVTFKTMTTFTSPPPAATFIAFNPEDNNIIAIGMDDSTIQIYNVRVDEVKHKLRGHSKRITGLSFSNMLKVLVSSGADAQICVWSSEGWEKKMNTFLPIPVEQTQVAQSGTRVQFHQDQIHFLAVNEMQLAIYETTKLECMKQWAPRKSTATIIHAAFSCDSQLVYASFTDASICVFSVSNLRPCCRITPASYLPPSVSNSGVHPLVIAAHPQEPNQFAVGLSNGEVHVFEPLESEAKWCDPQMFENESPNGRPAASSARPPGSDQGQR